MRYIVPKQRLVGAARTVLRRMAQRVRIAKRVVGHYRKTAFNRPDVSWDFFQFERRVHPLTWDGHDDISAWAQSCSQHAATWERPELYETSDDPVVRQGYTLMQEVIQKYRGRFSKQELMRVLVHVPSWRSSPGGYS